MRYLLVACCHIHNSYCNSCYSLFIFILVWHLQLSIGWAYTWWTNLFSINNGVVILTLLKFTSKKYSSVKLAYKCINGFAQIWLITAYIYFVMFFRRFHATSKSRIKTCYTEYQCRNQWLYFILWFHHFFAVISCLFCPSMNCALC
jgi:hypothetical protein